MPELSDILLLLLAGAAGGFLSGLLGVGGGIIFIPILDIVMQHYGIRTETVRYILANSLTVIIFTGIFNSYQQYKAGNFFPKAILNTAVPGIVTVLAGSWLITQGNWYDKKTFNLVFVSLLVPGVLRMLFQKNGPIEGLKSDIAAWRFWLVGFFTGIFTALSGLGGGLIMIPAFVNGMKFDLKKATSVSAGVVPFFAFPTAIYYMFGEPSELLPHDTLGYVSYWLTVPMIIGTLSTVPLGVRTGHKMKPLTGKIIFATFLVLVIGKLLFENFTS